MTVDQTTARQLLHDERAALLRSLRSVIGDLHREETGLAEELADIDQHPADVGTEVHDMARDLGLRTDMRRQLDENGAALDRVTEGTYGVCRRCGQPIPDERLEAVPSTRYCVNDEVAAAAHR